MIKLKENMREKSQKAVFGVLILFISLWVLVGCSSEDSASEPSEEDTKVEEVKEEEVKAKEDKEDAGDDTSSSSSDDSSSDSDSANSDGDKGEVKEEDQAVKEEIMVSVVKQQFEGTAEVAFDKEEKLIKIVPSDPQFIIELADTMEGNISQDSWDGLVASVAEMSSSITEGMGEGYSVVLVNPVNEGNYLLMVMDGTVLYDVFDDM